MVSRKTHFAGGGDPAGLVPVVNEVEWEVGGAVPAQRWPPPTRGRRAAGAGDPTGLCGGAAGNGSSPPGAGKSGYPL